MPETAVAADFHQPLDVHRDLLAKIALDPTHFFDHAADLPDVVLGEILDADVRADARLSQDVAGPLASDAVDIGESKLDPLGARKIDAGNTSHVLSLPLLVLRVRADDAHHPTAADHLALVTNPFDRRSDLHDVLCLPGYALRLCLPDYAFRTIRPRVPSLSVNSTITRSPTSSLTKFRSMLPVGCAVTRRSPSTCTW